MSDVKTACGSMPLTFLQMLASSIIIDGNGVKRLNVIEQTGTCAGLEMFLNCTNGDKDPERTLVENLFATDSCGNLGLKIFVASRT